MVEICVAEPILISVDALYALGSFLEQAARHFSEPHMARIEHAILSLVREADSPEIQSVKARVRNRLLARIPLEKLTSVEGRSLRASFQQHEPELAKRLIEAWQDLQDNQPWKYEELPPAQLLETLKLDAHAMDNDELARAEFVESPATFTFGN
jgi:hypothetical protein